MWFDRLFHHLRYKLFVPGSILRKKYEAFRELLKHDGLAHELMASLQESYHGDRQLDFAGIRKLYAEFATSVAAMVDNLCAMEPGVHVALQAYFRKFDFYIRFLLEPPAITIEPPYVLPLERVDAETEFIGNKARNLALMGNRLQVPVPAGFVLTTSADHFFIEYNGLRKNIDALLAQIDIRDPQGLLEISKRLQELFLSAELPLVIQEAMAAAFAALAQGRGAGFRVAVRSSGACEDSAFSFAGQYRTVLDVNREGLADACQQVLASRYSPEALAYRIRYGLHDEATPMSVLVVEMISSRAAGVIYTRAPESGAGEPEEAIHIYGVPGPGEQLVSGRRLPERWVVARQDPGQEYFHALAVGQQESLLSQAQVARLVRWAVAIESLFGCPQDIEWVLDRDNRLVILQARPLGITAPVPEETGRTGTPAVNAPVLLRGGITGAGGVGSGPVYLVGPTSPLEAVPEGAVLVCRDLPPAAVRVINRLAAVVAERGSVASHFATVAREFHLPLLVGTRESCRYLPPGLEVTVDSDRRIVYQGKVTELLKKRRPDQKEETPYYRVMGSVMSFIEPLQLVDPDSPDFQPERCRSMHDIIRYCHEKAVQSLFLADQPGVGRGSRKLETALPLVMYLFDVGGGLAETGDRKGLTLEQVTCRPFQAVWKGLSHPDIRWQQQPFDWDGYDRAVLAGGIPPDRDSFQYASYGVVGRNYMHLSIRFGYHFAIMDVVCGDEADTNYLMLRFAGGGGDFTGRSLRIEFLVRVLEKEGMEVSEKGDLLEARLAGIACCRLLVILEDLGRLLAVTKLMDMRLKDEAMVAEKVRQFFAGEYGRL